MGNKAVSTSYKPGQSGNPSGRPKLPEEIREEAKKTLQSLLPVALKRLKEIIETSTNEKNVMSAVDTILDRNMGKAIQGLEIGNKDNKGFEISVDFNKLTDEQLKKIIE